MSEKEQAKLLDCPICAGPGLLEETDHRYYSISCLDCGCNTVPVEFHGDADRAGAIEKVITLWNTGKVIAQGRGE